MGEIRQVPLVMPLAGLLADSQERLTQANLALAPLLGAPIATTNPIPFRYTQYYEKEMGANLWRQFLIFGELQAAEKLVAWKQAANELEQTLSQGSGPGRRVNIDPGYLAPGKLVLASTKDHEQRIYLAQGIFAENTLRIRDGGFRAWDWTYPDYAEAIPFFNQAYQEYRRRLVQKQDRLAEAPATRANSEA
jgi:hypothetical protein